MHFDLMLLDEERHASALESLSLQHLAAGDLKQAFRLADRRCRILPIAKAHHYTLRGEIHHQLGDVDAAIADITRALELAPHNISANRRMLAWSESPDRISSARRLLDVEQDFHRIAEAVTALCETGQCMFAAAEWTETTINGWAVWESAERVRAVIENEDGGASAWLSADPEHPLAAEALSAANFTLERPRSRTSQRLALYQGETLFYQKRLRPNAQDRPANGVRRRIAAPSETDAVTVLLPVYGDFDATKACLDSLLCDVKGKENLRVIIIDDASPEPRIKQLVSAVQEEPGIQLISNAQNLGFAESINRGLAAVERGDIVLLNADTIVPPGFIARLRAAAHSTPDIGTVTPLSNNGEFTSFPVPFRSNPIGTYDEICALDTIAARVNADRVIDLPNGIGFCLYVTRACLDAVGRLSDAFRRGYYEDVDFCLRASELGFRNVCAAGVFVGHAGSRSFGAEKRSLVVRNLETIEQWFPKYRLESAAFLEADPLRPVREALERAMLPQSKKVVVLICGSGVTKSVAEARAQSLVSEGADVLLVEFCAAAGGPAMKVSDPSRGVPQSIAFRLAATSECAEALDYLRRVTPTRIEIVDTTKIPAAVLESILQLQCPVDLLIADGSLLCPRGAFMGGDASACNAPRRNRLCNECLFGLASAGTDSKALQERKAMWARLLNRARYIYAPDPYAKSFATHFLGRREVTIFKRRDFGSAPAMAAGACASERSIGFAAVGDGITEFKLMKYAALAINRAFPERSVVIIGETIDDIGLMRLDNIHVTGCVEADEYDRVLQHYAVGKLFIPVGRPLFGHPKVVELSRRMPSAFFDWSLGKVPSRPTDLALSPYLTEEEFTTALVKWVAQ